jgi:hypothetical protein
LKKYYFVAENGVFRITTLKAVIFQSNSGKYFYTGNSVKSRYISTSNCGKYFTAGKR